VEDVHGQRVTLNKRHKTHLKSELFKVNDVTPSIDNPIENSNMENRTTRRPKQAGVGQQNISESK
jgi:hypothetical protein